MRKYKIITKIGNKTDGTAHCVKYNTSDLIKFTQFMDTKYPTWRWFNVYCKETGQQVGNFTKNNRPSVKYI